MKQYLELARRILEEGEWVENSRTGVRCKTVINADFEYDVGNGIFPILTTRKVNMKSAIAELLGYIRGYDNAKQFKDIGCNTWHANADNNKAWLDNFNRKGVGDMGRVYGVQGRGWRSVDLNIAPDYKDTDQLRKVYDNLRNGIDDRGEIITFWNPGEFDLGCLRPCMHTHNFSILGDTLHLTSYQRSCDVPLGLVFNKIQCYVFLELMAQITGHKPGKVYHKIVNAHIYENQIPTMETQLLREPTGYVPSLIINPDIKTLEDIETWVTVDDFTLINYIHKDPIYHPFTV